MTLLELGLKPRTWAPAPFFVPEMSEFGDFQGGPAAESLRTRAQIPGLAPSCVTLDG